MTARRPWAWPLVPLYAAGLRLKDSLRRAPRRLAHPVLSIGSLSAGGAGKTPVTIALVTLLQAKNLAPQVLSRGYGRSTNTVEGVLPDLDNAAARFGDEPTLIARRTGAETWVAPARFAAGRTAEELSHAARTGARLVHVLDDGFQHRQLHRDFDIVLLTAEDLDDPLLPAGNRREPWSALRRADAVVVRLDERERVVPFARLHMRPQARIWVIRRTLHFPPPLGVLSAGLRPLAFCAIARPEAFADMIKVAGCGLIDTLAFADHHAYTPADIDTILGTATNLRASGFITTAKDAVKLTPAMRSRLETLGPLVVAELTVDFAAPGEVLADLARVLA